MTTLQELWMMAGAIIILCSIALIVMATNQPRGR